MHREHRLDHLAFEDDRVLDDEIESIPGVHMNVSIADWKPHLGVDAHGDTFRQDGMKKHAAYSVDSAVRRRPQDGSQY